MAEFTVTVQELTKQAEELRSLKSQFVTAVEQLMSTEGALNGMWEGDAREAFHAAFTSDSSDEQFRDRDRELLHRPREHGDPLRTG